MLEVYPVVVKLLSCGDVVEMGDTLVLETSACARESSNLSIPTSRFSDRGQDGNAAVC